MIKIYYMKEKCRGFLVFIGVYFGFGDVKFRFYLGIWLNIYYFLDVIR